MTFRTGWNLPPGCTDRHIDEAAPGYYDDPQAMADEELDETLCLLIEEAETSGDHEEAARLNALLEALRQ